MKRNMDLVRTILIDAELKTKNESDFYMPKIEGHTEEEVSYHIGLMDDAGLIDSYKSSDKTNGTRYYLKRLTWEGHDFLEAARNDTVWNSAKATAKSKGLELGIDLMKELLVTTTRSILFGG